MSTRRWATLGVVLTSALAVAGCGSSGPHFKNASRPPLVQDVTVYINEHRISVSPGSVGAGPATLFFTNETAKTQDAQVKALAGSGASRTSGPLNAGTPGQIQMSLSQGDYAISAGKGIPPTVLHVGKAHGNANGALLQP
ncbi:MAG: hypothetical protein J2O48_11210 [Solirubrobacterales bacterium]|nr:hypothetical protein [Solirubrobacterales bacterium]